MKYEDLSEIREIVKEIDEFMIEYVSSINEYDRRFYKILIKINLDALKWLIEK